MAKIKPYVEELLTTILFVDVDTGRGVGYDYASVVALVKKRFPKSRVSVRNLWGWYAYNMQSVGKRLPVRRRSRRILARDYTRALLMAKDSNGVGKPFASVTREVNKVFPEVLLHSTSTEAKFMEKIGYKLPPRTKAVVEP